MQCVPKVDEMCGLKKLPIPVLYAVKWGVVVGLENTTLAADGGAKAICTTIQFALIVTTATMGLAQGLSLKKDG
jgi:hypothetical protein